LCGKCMFYFFFSSRRRHTRSKRDWSSDVCSSDLDRAGADGRARGRQARRLLRAVSSGITSCERAASMPARPSESTASCTRVRQRSEERRVGKEGRAGGVAQVGGGGNGESGG